MTSKNATPPLSESRELLQKFINLCKSIDKSADMSKILQKKLVKHYESADTKYISSQDFKSLLLRHHSKLEKSHRDCYVFIADLVSELKSRKAKGKTEDDESAPPEKKARREEASPGEAEEEPDTYESRNKKRKIKTLSKTLSKLHKTIKKLEEKEVDWEDENNSHYIMLQRYKERACKVFDKLCEYTNEPKDAGRVFKREFVFTGTKLEKVNRCIAKYLRMTGEFPDYLDVLDVIRSANDDENLNLSTSEVERIAKKAFIEIGEQLQRRRQDDDADTMLSLLETDGTDPADEDPELQAKLQANKQHWNKINEIIDDFAEGRPTEDDNPSESDGSDEDEDENENDNENADANDSGEDDLNSENDNGEDDASSEKDKSSDEQTEEGDGNHDTEKDPDEEQEQDSQENKESSNEKEQQDSPENKESSNEKEQVGKEANLHQEKQNGMNNEVVFQLNENGSASVDKGDERTNLSDVPNDLSSCKDEQLKDENISPNGVCEKVIAKDRKSTDEESISNSKTVQKCHIKGDSNPDEGFVDAHKIVKVEKELSTPHQTSKIRVRSAASLGGRDFVSPRRKTCRTSKVIEHIVIDLD